MKVYTLKRRLGIMKRKRYTEPQLVFALQQAEAGTAAAAMRPGGN